MCIFLNTFLFSNFDWWMEFLFNLTLAVASLDFRIYLWRQHFVKIFFFLSWLKDNIQKSLDPPVWTKLIHSSLSPRLDRTLLIRSKGVYYVNWLFLRSRYLSALEGVLFSCVFICTVWKKKSGRLEQCLPTPHPPKKSSRASLYIYKYMYMYRKKPIINPCVSQNNYLTVEWFHYLTRKR